jgi:hypothetical protein
MVTATDVIQAVGARLSNTTTILLEAAQIDACDEDAVTPVGPAFIKKYHHFSYAGPGVLTCRYIKGVDPAVRHTMKQGTGIVAFLFLHSALFFLISQCVVTQSQLKKMCGECGNPYDKDADEDWFRCKGCKQWYHRECLELDESACEDQFFVFNSCQKCEAANALLDIDDEEDNETDIEEGENNSTGTTESDLSESESESG